MAPDQYRRLADDIKAHGLHHPIVLFDGAILDGRHRYRACVEVGVEPRFTTFDGADPVAYVTSENAARRHLTPSQIAHAVAAMKPYEERKARERQIAAGTANVTGKSVSIESDKGRTAEKLAMKAGVGVSSINRAIKVREHGTPELNAAVAAGEIALNQAEKIVQLNPSAQRKVIEAPKQQRGDALREAMNRSDSAKRRDAKKFAPVEQLSTSFVRKFLSGIERVAMICAEDGEKDGPSIATRFLDEMDWDAAALTIQLERCEPVFRALAIIQQQARKAA
jgi:ParB-like chromosome segregation protein Spo0J